MELTLEERIIDAIQKITNEYQDNQGLILNEADLKCHIFRKIYDFIPDHSVSTDDPTITATPLHSEIRFYDEDGRLSLIPDITILDPTGMSIKHGMSIRFKNNRFAYGKLPTKGFEFKGKATIIEIKFEKSKSGISEATVRKIRKDIDKIKRLMERNNRPNEDNKIFGIVVVFNKTNNCHQSFNQLMQQYSETGNIKLIYGSGNVEF